LIATLILKML